MKSAQEKLYDLIYPLLLYWASRLRYSNQDKHELINEAWLYIQKHILQCKMYPSPVVHWAVLSAQRKWAEKRRKYHPKITSLALVNDPLILDKSLISIVHQESFLHIIRGLTPKERLIFRLVYLQGQTQREIAHTLGTSNQCISYHYRKGLQKLKNRHGKNHLLEK